MVHQGMYRDSQQSFAQTIERLEQELAELHALHRPPRPRERTLWAVTALSVVASALAVAACASAHERAGVLQMRLDAAASRLDARTQDLRTCVEQVQDDRSAAQQCRIDAWQAMALVPQAAQPPPPSPASRD